MPVQNDTFELRSAPGARPRYHLGGSVVHNGDVIEIELETGWRAVRVEGMPEQLLGFGLVPACVGGVDLAVLLPRAGRYRWPR
jgi:hypothetical protein